MNTTIFFKTISEKQTFTALSSYLHSYKDQCKEEEGLLFCIYTLHRTDLNYFYNYKIWAPWHFSTCQVAPSTLEHIAPAALSNPSLLKVYTSSQCQTSLPTPEHL